MDCDVEKLKVWMVKKKLEGQSVKSICTQVRVSRKMFYYWWNRYQTHGWSGLQEKTKGRPSNPEIDKALKDKIIKLRTRYEWAKKITGYLTHRGVEVNHHQIYKHNLSSRPKSSHNRA